MSAPLTNNLHLLSQNLLIWAIDLEKGFPAILQTEYPAGPLYCPDGMHVVVPVAIWQESDRLARLGYPATQQPSVMVNPVPLYEATPPIIPGFEFHPLFGENSQGYFPVQRGPVEQAPVSPKVDQGSAGQNPILIEDDEDYVPESFIRIGGHVYPQCRNCRLPKRGKGRPSKAPGAPKSSYVRKGNRDPNKPKVKRSAHDDRFCLGVKCGPKAKQVPSSSSPKTKRSAPEESSFHTASKRTKTAAPAVESASLGVSAAAPVVGVAPAPVPPPVVVSEPVPAGPVYDQSVVTVSTASAAPVVATRPVPAPVLIQTPTEPIRCPDGIYIPNCGAPGAPPAIAAAVPPPLVASTEPAAPAQQCGYFATAESTADARFTSPDSGFGSTGQRSLSPEELYGVQMGSGASVAPVSFQQGFIAQQLEFETSAVAPIDYQQGFPVQQTELEISSAAPVDFQLPAVEPFPVDVPAGEVALSPSSRREINPLLGLEQLPVEEPSVELAAGVIPDPTAELDIESYLWQTLLQVPAAGPAPAEFVQQAVAPETSSAGEPPFVRRTSGGDSVVNFADYVNLDAFGNGQMAGVGTGQWTKAQ